MTLKGRYFFYLATMYVIYKSLTKYCTHIIIVNAVNAPISRSISLLPNIVHILL